MEYDKTEQRFSGVLSDEYRLIFDTHPHLPSLQSKLGLAVAEHVDQLSNKRVEVLEIGCGDGYTAEILLDAHPAISLIALDSEPKMIASANANLSRHVATGRCNIVEQNALSYLRTCNSDSLPVVASAMTLHNIHVDERNAILAEIFRVLTPGGLFVSADKHVPEPTEQFVHLHKRITSYFDYFLPLQKPELLQEWVLHEIDDASPERIMREAETKSTLNSLGFKKITFSAHNELESLLTVHK